MEPKDFKNGPGKCIRQSTGYYAYVPNPLPPKLEIDWKLATLMADAERAMGELAGLGRTVQNPYLIINPYQHREAHQSSKIENTQAELEDVYRFEAEAPVPERSPDVKEVSNYIAAMDHGLSRLKKLPISLRLIREIHEKLTRGVRGDRAYPGEFRKSQNWIGPPGCTLSTATFVPPPVQEMNQALHDLEKYLHSKAEEPPLIQCALMHYQFETIHPFVDGNGRIGRLLITFFLCERGFLTQPLLYLSAFIEKYRDEYYRLLLGVSQKGDWRSWIEFFLRGVDVQSREAIEDAKKILALHGKYKKMLVDIPRVPQAAIRLADQVFLNPVVSISKLSSEWKMSFPTVKKGVDKLVELKILKESTGQKRNKIYVAEELLHFLPVNERNHKT